MAAQKNCKVDDELMEMLKPTRSIDLRIQKTIADLPEKSIVLLLEKLNEYALINARLVKYFCENNIPGVYVSTNKPIDVLTEYLTRQGVDCKKILFIDAITIMGGEEGKEETNVEYIDSPKNLIDLSVAIEAAMQKIKAKKKFIMVDSLSTLLVYNKPSVVEKFVHSIAGKIRVWKATGILIMLEGKDYDTTKTIAQFCDETIEI